MSTKPPEAPLNTQPPKTVFKASVLWEAIIVIFLAGITYWIASKTDPVDRFYQFSQQYEKYELDEIVILFVFFMLYFLVLALRKWRQAVNANHELQKAAREIKQLRGIIPICASCKSIRNDEGYWQKVEEYIKSRTDVRFTHGLCPECFVKLYPEVKLSKDRLEEWSGQFDTNGTEIN